MHFVWFLVSLALTGFVFLKIEPLIVAPTLLLSLHAAARTLSDNQRGPNSPFARLAGITHLLVTNYVILGWCTFVVCVTRTFAYDLSVSSPRLYWVTGFFGCIGPITYMADYDVHWLGNVSTGSMLGVLITSTAFIVFPWLPSLMKPWNWIVYWFQ